MPTFDVQTWGDYPHYVERTRLAMVRCNANRESALRFCNDRFHNRKITRLRNNFMPNILPTDLCANTPTLAIHDNRGFAIRTLAYNRRDHNETIGELISRNRYNASGQLIASR
ncbi:hypothetical protein AVJ24_04130, partial [Yersinia pestis]